MVFSGYTLAEAHALAEPAVAELLDLTDILVDGPYAEATGPDTGATLDRFRSTSASTRPIATVRTIPAGGDGNTLEIRLADGAVI